MNKKIMILGVIVIIGIIAGLMFFRADKGGKEENTLVMGLDDSFPPMGFRNENNEIVGFDIDVAQAVCDRLGMELKLQQISWAAKEQELNSGNIDCIWNGFALNEERAATMNLTDPYIKGELYFILKNDSKIKDQEELRGKKVGVQAGSVQQSDLEQSDLGKDLEIVQYSDFLTAFMDLETGGIDAVCASSLIGNYLITSKNKDFITMDSRDISTSRGCVIAFKLGNDELKDKIQNTLYELKKDGTLKEISEKWFGKDMILVKEK